MHYFGAVTMRRYGRGAFQPCGNILLASSSDTDPAGILYTIAGKPNIEFSRTKVDFSAMDFALQAGPLLVDPGGGRGIHSNDRIRANRTALCISDNDIIIVSVFSEGAGFGLIRNFSGGLSLFELSDILRAPATDGGFNCDRAINLVGGSYSQIYTAFGYGVGEVAGDKVPNLISFDRK